jgi:hypothetical protein
MLGYSGLAVFRESREQGYAQYEEAALMDLIIACADEDRSDPLRESQRQKETQCSLSLAFAQARKRKSSSLVIHGHTKSSQNENWFESRSLARLLLDALLKDIN